MLNCVICCQRNMEIEDVIAEQKKELQTKLDYTEKNCKILEVKAKNYQDQGMCNSFIEPFSLPAAALLRPIYTQKSCRGQ